MGKKLRPRPPARPTRGSGTGGRSHGDAARGTRPGPLKFLITLGICGFLLLVYLVRIGDKPKTEQIVESAPSAIVEQCAAINPLSGVCLKDAPQKRQVIGVMIDNSPVARPQKGLDKADLVFEAIAEFPYTRFLAFYSLENLPDKIGPVRSARPYFIDWAIELDAVYAHCGGSADALNLLKKNAAPAGGQGAKDLNEFSNQRYFYRSWNKVSPYNVFTSAELLNQALADKNWFGDKTDFTTWQFKDDVELANRIESQEISIDFGNKDFAVNWKYNKLSNSYARSLAGNDVKILAKNVALMHVDFVVKDNVGRRDVETIGTGDAVVFLDGKAIKGTWQKIDKNSRTVFYDEVGGEIKFNRGTTWVEVVDSGVKVAY